MKHCGIVNFFANYCLATGVLAIIAVILVVSGVNEDRIVKFVNDHRNAFSFIQAYLAYYITELEG